MKIDDSKNLISVVMCTYNGELFIEMQLSSILNQTLKPNELIICDDISDDKTLEKINVVLKKFEKIVLNNKIDVKIFENKKRLGVKENFKHALTFANGDILFFSDQDDYWEKDKIEIMVKTLKNKSLSCLISNISFQDENKNIIDIKETVYRYTKPYIYESIKGYKYLDITFNDYVIWSYGSLGCTLCFTKNVKNIADKIDSILGHDIKICLTATLIGKVGFLNKYLLKRTLHFNNVSGNCIKEPYLSVFNVLKKNERGLYKYLCSASKVIKIKRLKFYKMITYFGLGRIILKIRQIKNKYL